MLHCAKAATERQLGGLLHLDSRLSPCPPAVRQHILHTLDMLRTTFGLDSFGVSPKSEVIWALTPTPTIHGNSSNSFHVATMHKAAVRL